VDAGSLGRAARVAAGRQEHAQMKKSRAVPIPQERNTLQQSVDEPSEAGQHERLGRDVRLEVAEGFHLVDQAAQLGGT
jgi:hypothetical protein